MVTNVSESVLGQYFRYVQHIYLNAKLYTMKSKFNDTLLLLFDLTHNSDVQKIDLI